MKEKDLLFNAHLEVYVQKVHELVCKDLNLEPIRTEVRDLKACEHEKLKGSFSNALMKVTIIKDNMTTYFDLADVIAHETRHYWQYTKEVECFNDYVTCEENANAYYFHPTEVDARSYAYDFIREYESEIYDLSQKHVNREFELSEETLKYIEEEQYNWFKEELNWFEEELGNEPIWG